MTEVRKAYSETESFRNSIEQFRKEYFNAKTPYDQWKVFEQALNWIEAKEELEYYLKQDIKELKEKNG